MLQRMLPHLKLGIFGSKTMGASPAAPADALGAGGAGGSLFEQAATSSGRARNVRRIGALILSLAACGRQPSAPPSPAPRYLALGDSFTIGTGSSPSEAFPSRLVARWRGRGCLAELKNV